MSSRVAQLGCLEGSRGDQLRTALIDSVTHEFRSPLTSIKAAVTALLADRRVRPPQRDELLSIINEEADRLNRLVGNVIEVSRLDARVKLDLARQTIASIVDAAKDDCRTLFNRRALSVRFQPGLPGVWADLQRAKKALVQLLENATKYSPPDEPVTITANLSGKFVAISVEDRGSGIEDSEQALIFERFYRGKSHRNVVQGTGMGLPIASAIIEAHGGSLRVTSQRGHGSTFSFTLPVFENSSVPTESGGANAWRVSPDGTY